MWRDKDRGTSKGQAIYSREPTLTNSNQRVSMGTCGELASTGTYFLQRHSHICAALAVWAGSTLSLSHRTHRTHRTRPCSRQPDRLDSTSSGAVVAEGRASVLMTEDRQLHRSLLDAGSCCVTRTRWTWDPTLWGSRTSCGSRLPWI